MGINILFRIIAFIIGITVVLSLKSIFTACKNCIVLGSTKNYFSDIWDGSEGSLWIITGILIMCIPTYCFMKILTPMLRK